MWLKQTVHIPNNKVTFIPNGVDTDRFCPGRDVELRSKLGIREDEFVVGAIGRLDPVKNHEGLIGAVQLLQESGYPIRLVIVGDGPLRQKIELSAEASLRNPRALLLGYRSDVERLYRVFDVFVLNSFAEGMSNTLLEAMASGLPIVSTAVGGNVELVADAIRGSLILPGDSASLRRALEQIMHSQGIRESFGTNARTFVLEKFSIQRMIERYTALYESVSC
jgi:glycosyltransferase involved in cell wall biosynthesis